MFFPSSGVFGRDGAFGWPSEGLSIVLGAGVSGLPPVGLWIGGCPVFSRRRDRPPDRCLGRRSGPHLSFSWSGPSSERVTDQQVALYLEEHEPSLEAAIMGPWRWRPTVGPSTQTASPALLTGLVERAVDKARAVDYGRGIDRRGLYQGSGALAFLVVAALLFLFFGPGELRYGMRALVLPTTEAAEVSPYTISVLPGDVTVARGADQLIIGRTQRVRFRRRFRLLPIRTGRSPYQRLSMLPADSGRFDLLLLNLVENTEYFVEANGVRSASYTIEVADLPYVEGMNHTYFFPAYTGLSPREVEGGGDIAALAGTRVELLDPVHHGHIRGWLLVDDSVVHGASAPCRTALSVESSWSGRKGCTGSSWPGPTGGW